MTIQFLYLLLVWCITFFSLPIILVIVLFLRLTSDESVLFTQKRIGRKNKPFVLYKFRTMYRNAESEQYALRSLNEAHGPVFKIHNDPRFTPFGKFLSHTGLDELPQLLNVLRGEMAIFGPRPLPISEAKKLKPWQKKRHQVKPGIISPWIINGYHSTTFDAWMKSDIAYAQSKNTKEDVALFFKSITFCIHLLVNEIRSLFLGKKQQ